MKKAVILVGGKQYIATEKETLRVDLLPAGTKELELDALLVIDGDKTTVGTPTVKGVKVSAKVKTPLYKGDKIRVIRYKAKKRVHKETGQSKRSHSILLFDFGEEDRFSIRSFFSIATEDFAGILQVAKRSFAFFQQDGLIVPPEEFIFVIESAIFGTIELSVEIAHSASEMTRFRILPFDAFEFLPAELELGVDLNLFLVQVDTSDGGFHRTV